MIMFACNNAQAEGGLSRNDEREVTSVRNLRDDDGGLIKQIRNTRVPTIRTRARLTVARSKRGDSARSLTR